MTEPNQPTECPCCHQPIQPQHPRDGECERPVEDRLSVHEIVTRVMRRSAPDWREV